jgi:hypothetical protein
MWWTLWRQRRCCCGARRHGGGPAVAMRRRDLARLRWESGLGEVRLFAMKLTLAMGLLSCHGDVERHHGEGIMGHVACCGRVATNPYATLRIEARGQTRACQKTAVLWPPSCQRPGCHWGEAAVRARGLGANKRPGLSVVSMSKCVTCVPHHVACVKCVCGAGAGARSVCTCAGAEARLAWAGGGRRGGECLARVTAKKLFS